MESANLRQQLQDQFVGSSSSSLATPSSYGASTTAHAWSQNFTLNTSDLGPAYNGAVLNPRQKSEALTPPLNSSMIQDHLGFHWSNNAGSFTSQIKEELSSSFPKFTEMLNSPASSIEDSSQSSTTYIKNEQKDLNIDLSEKLLLKTISSGFPINGEIYANACPGFGSPGIPTRGNFSQIYPSVNISNLTQSSPSISGSFDNMHLQALDLLTNTRFSGCFGHCSQDNLGLYRESLSVGIDHHLQQSSYSPNKVSSPTNVAITEAKRPNSNSLMEPKATQAATKKSRLEPRASCPPFKVRKEKLGDRIAALQQLVAPFGKTDTASVLMEAIGYIKFLQNQVETLSVPYMKSSRNRTNRTTMQTGSTAEDGSEEPRRDLRSRGLCLVPLSCLSYVTSDTGGSGGGMWPPPNFGGGT